MVRSLFWQRLPIMGSRELETAFNDDRTVWVTVNLRDKLDVFPITSAVAIRRDKSCQYFKYMNFC